MKQTRFLHIVWTLTGVVAGGVLAWVALPLMRMLRLELNNRHVAMVLLGAMALFGLLAFLTRRPVVRKAERGLKWLKARPIVDLAVGVGGLIVGLVVAFLLTRLTEPLPNAAVALLINILLYIVFGYLGVTLGLNHREGWRALFPARFRHRRRDGETELPAKVLDTSVLIDGRIEALLSSGFLEGTLVVEDVVLDELQALSDSADAHKREGGRRGLEVLRRIREKYADRLVTAEAERGETRTTDEILMDAAKTLNGKLVTNDYNLGKVAAVRGIGVLNLNDLTNALRPAYRAGDRMTVRPLKAGRETGQGVAYLADGTMVVVDRGAEDLERDIEVVVTSALQTSAGRMIFARKEEQKI